MVLSGVAVAILLVRSNLPILALVMAATGFLNGPLDVALFTLRQRRTPTAWTGRAFAVSMSFNYLGLPVGSAVAGIVAAHSIEAAIMFGVLACFVSGALVALTVPAVE